MSEPTPTGPAPDDAAGSTDAVPVIVLNRDLLFGMRIRNALGSIGYAPTFVRDTAEFVAALRAGEPPAALGVIDMNAPVDWPLIREAADDPAVPTPLLAFGPHVDVEGRRAAKGAGVTRIVSNGEFHRDTVGLLRRYARPDPAAD